MKDMMETVTAQILLIVWKEIAAQEESKHQRSGMSHRKNNGASSEFFGFLRSLPVLPRKTVLSSLSFVWLCPLMAKPVRNTSGQILLSFSVLFALPLSSFWFGGGEVGVSVYEMPAGIKSMPLISSCVSEELGFFPLIFFPSNSVLWEVGEWNKGTECCQWSSGTEARAAELSLSLNSFALAGLNRLMFTFWAGSVHCLWALTGPSVLVLRYQSDSQPRAGSPADGADNILWELR